MDEPSVEYDAGFIDGIKEGKRQLQQRITELGIANKQLLELSENLNEHPEGYEGPCLCKLCKSYC